jgi:hypothetical protein
VGEVLTSKKASGRPSPDRHWLGRVEDLAGLERRNEVVDASWSGMSTSS